MSYPRRPCGDRPGPSAWGDTGSPAGARLYLLCLCSLFNYVNHILQSMVVREVLKVSLFSTRKEGRDEARKLLEHTPAEILLPVLVPVIGAPAEKVGSKQWWSETSRLRAGE